MELTNAKLRLLAGSAYPRGEAYFRAGNVMSCAVVRDGIEGVVVGGEQYKVRVETSGGELLSTCTCPVGNGCKHAVALVLAFLDRSSSVRVEAPAGLVGTRDELVAYAKQRGAAHALDLAADLLLPRLNGVYVNPHSLYGLALRDTGAWTVIRRYLPNAASALAAATLARLDEEGARVAEAIAEEAARRIEPEDTAVRPLWKWLAGERAACRALSSPRPKAWRAEQKWTWDPRDRCVRWKEREDLTQPTFGRMPAAARLAAEHGILRIDCRCTTTPARCAHALALIDATLDAIDARPEEARAIATELMRPPWSRALAELALHTAAAAAPPQAIEIAWRVEHELRVPTLTAVVRKQTKRGPSKGARIAAPRLIEQYRERLDARDLAIAEALAGWDPSARHSASYPARAFAAAVGHPRLVDEHDQPLALARATLGFTAVAAGDDLCLAPALGDEPLDRDLATIVHESLASGEPVLLHDGDRLMLVDIGEDARRLWGVIDRHGAVFPPEAHAELLDSLARLDGKLPISIPTALKGTAVAGDLVTVLRLRLQPDATLELEPFVRPAPGSPLYPPGFGPRDLMFAREGQRAYVRRDFEAEQIALKKAVTELLVDESIAEEGPPGCFRIGAPEQALMLVARLDDLPPGVEAEWVSDRPVVAGTYGSKALRVKVDHDRDWFGIAGELKVEAGRIELAVLLDAARRQQRYVRAGANRWIELTRELRERLRAIADQTYEHKGRIELSPGAVPAIAALGEAGAKVSEAPAWHTLSEKLASAERLRPRPPSTLGATLRDYQIDGHAWMTRVAAWGGGACLADDMGLGKTVQAIALLLDRAKLGPTLVLAPTSVCFNWVDELGKFAPSLKPIVYGEQADRAACLAKLGKKDVLIASYGLLVRDAEKLAGVSFGTLVIDEAQALKNATTQRAKAARGLKAEFRVALSGTPLENHLGELWSIFSIVFPGLLGSWDQFRDRYATPYERGVDMEARAALARVIKPFLLRRTKSEVARELPSRTEIQVPVVLSAEERELYDDARLSAIAHLEDKSLAREEQRRFQVLAALTRLRLLASHPKLYDPNSVVGSSKLRRLVELLDTLRAEGHRALVFSQFTSHLALVREELERVGVTTLYLDGATPAAARRTIVAKFQAGEADAFLISLKAGGTGLNLTAADYVIHLDPWWNPAVEDQATDRAHRIGQTRPVTVYRLIAKGTIEDKILALHADKRALVASVLEGTSGAARLTTRDLLSLLAGGGEGIVDDDAPAPVKRPHLRLVP